MAKKYILHQFYTIPQSCGIIKLGQTPFIMSFSQFLDQVIERLLT
jgi:hypothetical protein